MTIIKTFVKNYGYGSFIGILSRSNDSEWQKASLQYYQVSENCELDPIVTSGKETRDLEKLARVLDRKSTRLNSSH